MSSALIFVVDDEPVIVETLAVVLQRHGYSAIAFTNPLAALSAAHLKPDLLLCDFRMPEMDGLTLAVEFQKQCPTCKVLMFSGAISQARNHPAVARFAFLEKPLSPPELLARISATLNSPPVDAPS
jgi:DNA-binding response OmpR family regulator